MNWGVRNGLAGAIYGGLLVAFGLIARTIDNGATEYIGGVALFFGGVWVVFALIDIARGLQDQPADKSAAEDD